MFSEPEFMEHHHLCTSHRSDKNAKSPLSLVGWLILGREKYGGLRELEERQLIQMRKASWRR